MVRTRAFLCATLAACSFTPSGGDELRIDAATDDAAALDAATDDAAPLVDAAEIDARVVDAPPPVDAREIDAAPPIDAPPMCPVGYVAGYRYIATTQSWRSAEDDCEDDSNGLTHLVVINDQAELDGINAAIATDIWVGVVRNPTSGGGGWRWRWVTGGDATFLPWEGGQPDNASGEQLVVTLVNDSGRLRDIDISISRAALCECDRMPPVEADYLDP